MDCYIMSSEQYLSFATSDECEAEMKRILA